MPTPFGLFERLSRALSELMGGGWVNRIIHKLWSLIEWDEFRAEVNEISLKLSAEEEFSKFHESFSVLFQFW